MLDLDNILPVYEGRLRAETWGGLHYIRDLPCINVVNDTAYFILSRCDGSHTPDAIAREMQAEFEAPLDRLSADVREFVLHSARCGYVRVPGLTSEALQASADDGTGDGPRGESNLLDHIGVIGQGDNVLSAPIKVLIETTHNCNLRCVHCFADADCVLESRHGWLPGELDTDGWRRVIDNVADAGVFDIFVSGGEPLIRDDIFEIVEHIKSRGLGFCLLSNLTLLDDEKAERMKALGCYKVEGNMDGPDAESYDAFRGVPGAFDATVKGIRACQKAGLPLRLNLTATRLNIHHLKDAIRTTASLGVKELCVVPLERGGRARSDWEKLGLDVDDQVELTEYYREVAAWAQETYGDSFCYVGPCDLLLDNRDNRVVDLIDPNRILPLCGAGKFHCSVAPSGRVILCPTAGTLIPIEPGDCVNEDFRRIWNDADAFRALRNIDVPACRNCEYQNCGGGCQVNAYLKYGKIGAFPDTECRKVYYAKMRKAGLSDAPRA